MPRKKAEPVTGPKGIDKAIESGADPNADLESVTTDNKSQSALALKLSGASYTDIAKVVGYSSAYHARQAVEQVLAASADSPEDRDKMRVLIDRRLNRLLQSVMSKAVNPKDPQHLAYNGRALALVDRQAKLWGVDAPVQVTVAPADSYIHEYAQRLLGVMDQDKEAVEADIIDADILEEG